MAEAGPYQLRGRLAQQREKVNRILLFVTRYPPGFERYLPTEGRSSFLRLYGRRDAAGDLGEARLTVRSPALQGYLEKLAGRCVVVDGQARYYAFWVGGVPKRGHRFEVTDVRLDPDAPDADLAEAVAASLASSR